MKRLMFYFVIGILITACNTANQHTTLEHTDIPLSPTNTYLPPTATLVPPTATQTHQIHTLSPPTTIPTETKTPSKKRVQIQTAEELIGIWQRIRNWDNLVSYLRFNPDGTFQYARRSQQKLDSEPADWGEWWFEDGYLHLQEKGTQGVDAWEECGSEIIGIYTVTLEPAGNIELKPKTDQCQCNATGENCRREMLYGDWERIEQS